MKKRINNGFTLLLAIAVMFGMAGCKKLAANYLDTDLAVDQVILQNATGSAITPKGYGSGLGSFTLNNIVITGTSPDTLRYTIVATYSSVNTVAPKNVGVTLGLDDTKRTAYNTANSTNYLAFNANMYRILNKSLTIKAGSIYDTTVLEVYPKNVDLSSSWLLPVSITDASGVQLSGNQNTMYFHIIGNPLAGTYKSEWIRYNNDAGTGTPAFDTKGTTSFLPVNPTTISALSGTGVSYILSFTNTNGVFSNFSVSFDPADVANAGITITTGPTIILADGAAKKFTFNFHYLNSAGAARNITDIFTP